MRKTILFAAVAAIALTACDKSNEFHQTGIVNDYQIAFADQTTDSVQYVTTEVHSLSSSANWCQVNDTYQESVNKQIQAHPGIYQLTAYLNYDLNTTGKLRTSTFTVRGGEYVASCLLVQLGNLEVARPSIVVSPDLSGDSISRLNISANAGTDSIVFRTNYPWEVSVPEGSFITLDKHSGKEGYNVVHFSFQKNPGKERSEKITLASLCTPSSSQASAEGEVERITSRIPVVQPQSLVPTGE